ncbi:hypothetical protein BMT55_01140 [Listeria newyorkensis]|uniref:DUF1700 domain-containing protein n=1 Tax=Listeria newyorkensis TaxID=1497681 RepID=A0ABX4XR88_9LIST|nr:MULTISPECIES: DUF1700 domain-containing protein [Listeria]KGL39128.1 hypothetical protein EP56_14555 [Listeriaceae bacterium FSL A5-0209]KGL43885.1 hypothetical protein EP58_05350 [Listeria newyorkensis]KMT63274.1 hypothetical protein X559_0347 [Listeria newyorkensis]PNP94984.1 hypothetical protein BMT55_01140 [Listeria newyorkensis]RQW66348.1 DUF1700 domain-containing protein [Listeria sp. SHR_NRA_18]
MDKTQFLDELALKLAGLDSEERQEILADYMEHFAAGETSGKTEQEIVFDLGSPDEIARDILAGRGESLPEEPYYVPRPSQPKKRGAGFKTGVFLAMLIPNLVVYSLLLSFWGVVAGFIGSTVGFFLTPFGFILDAVLNQAFEWYKFFGTIGIVGLGFIFFVVTIWMAKAMIMATVGYTKFNMHLMKGESKHV